MCWQLLNATHLNSGFEGFIFSLERVQTRHLALQRLNLGRHGPYNGPLSFQFLVTFINQLLLTPLQGGVRKLCLLLFLVSPKNAELCVVSTGQETESLVLQPMSV